MHECQYPTQQQRHGKDDEQVSHVYARRIGRKEDGQEGKDGNQSCPQKRHGRPFTYGSHRFHAWLAPFQVYQDAVNYHDGIVYQHSHCENKSSQRYPLHGTVHHAQ